MASRKFQKILKENFITVKKELGQYVDDKYSVAYYEGFDELENKKVFIKHHDGKEVDGVTKTYVSTRYSENDEWVVIGSYTYKIPC
jgi:hypothetical protein